MNLLNDCITYVRRIVKSPSDAELSDALIIDYINRFWINDVDARMQLFDLKQKYQFQTTPGVDKYNMPLYSAQVQPGNQTIAMYPVYQGFTEVAYINGVQVSLQTRRDQFYKMWPDVLQSFVGVEIADGVSTNYNLQIPILGNPSPPNPPINGILRGHVNMAGIVATGLNEDPPILSALNTTTIPTTSIEAQVFITAIDITGANVVISDSGQFLVGNVNYGLLMKPGAAPFGNLSLGGYSTTLNTVNYLTGEINVTFPVTIPAGNNINVECRFFQGGMPRAILYYNNTLTLRAPPAMQYLVELEGYLTPAAFLTTEQALPYGYMTEYIARGAARKLLSDTGDTEQFMFYEPLFREQENLVWKRSQRQFTANRTQTIYSQGQYMSGTNNYSGGSF